MTQFLMAAALFVLAAARVPALIRNGRDTVFLAALFEGVSTVLVTPDLYFVLDPLVGGFNLTRLAGSTFMVLGLWFLRKAVLNAISPDAEGSTPWIRRLPLILALGLQVLFFVLSGRLPSTPAWGSYHSHPFPALFSLVVIVFVGWSCGQIAWVCLRFLRRMRRSFRVGFSMVALGCLIGVFVTAFMAIEVCRTPGWLPFLGPQSATPPPFVLLELVAIVLVGIGLTIPAHAGRLDRKRADQRTRDALSKVEAIRARALSGASMGRVLEADTNASPQERLHRMIVEIWDVEMATGAGSSLLTPDERSYLLSVETDLNLEHSK